LVLMAMSIVAALIIVLATSAESDHAAAISLIALVVGALARRLPPSDTPGA
jgi:hypothetical protein